MIGPAGARPASSAGRPRLQGVQALRGIAVMLVVIFHLGTIEAKYGGGGRLMPHASGAGVAGVDLFFAISGFVMATLMRGAFGGWRNAAGFLLRRAERIYPPYWVYTSLVLLARMIRSAWVNASMGGRIDVLASFLLIPAGSLPALMVGWTLIFEMGFYLAMALCLWLVPERAFPWALAAWAILAIAGACLIGDAGGPWAQTALNPMALEFIGGAALSLAYHRGALRLPRPVWWMAGAGLAMLAGFPLFEGAVGFAAYWARAAVFGAPACVILAAALSAEAAGGRPPAWLRLLGDASYSIYLSHVLVLSALGRAWASVARPGWFDNAVALPLLFAAALGAGWLSYRCLEVPLSGWFRARRLRGPGGS